METKTIEGVKTFLNDIINNANRLTSGNIAHNCNAIRLLAERALYELNEALAEQDRIARAEERWRCIRAAQDEHCKICQDNHDGRTCKYQAICPELTELRKALEGGEE